MKGRTIVYSDQELAWLEQNRLLPISDYYERFAKAFGRSDVSKINLHSLRKRRGWLTGRTGHFVKGGTPANKGQRMPWNANSAATQFKPGIRQGVAVRLYKPIGSERLSKEGYLQRKIHDGLPLQSRWRGVHMLNWEAINGPIPPGHALKCLDGDRLNTDPLNWECLPRAVMARLNGGRHKQRAAYDQVGPELKPAVMAIAKIQHAVAQRRCRAK